MYDVVAFVDTMKCANCENIVGKMTPMMEREFKIFPMPTCEKCHNDAFTGVWCTECNLYTQSSERPIVFREDTNWLVFACKNCLKQDDHKTVIIASTCHACGKRVVMFGDKTLYGPLKCEDQEGHYF